MPPITEQQVREILRDELKLLLAVDRYTFQKHIQMFDGRNIQTGRTTGTTIATATDQKLSVYGVVPVVQQGAVTSPSGGAVIDTQARTAIDSIRTVLRNFGITA